MVAYTLYGLDTYSGSYRDDRENDTQTGSSKHTAASILNAAEKGDARGVRGLIADGADIHATDKNGWTALMHAIKGRHIKVIADLIAAGAKTDTEARNGQTPLSIATKSGAPEVIALIALATSKA